MSNYSVVYNPPENQFHNFLASANTQPVKNDEMPRTRLVLVPMAF